MCIFEALMPLLAPKMWQETLQRIAQLPEQTVQRIAFGLAAFGLAVVWIVTL